MRTWKEHHSSDCSTQSREAHGATIFCNDPNGGAFRVVCATSHGLGVSLSALIQPSQMPAGLDPDDVADSLALSLSVLAGRIGRPVETIAICEDGCRGGCGECARQDVQEALERR